MSAQLIRAYNNLLELARWWEYTILYDYIVYYVYVWWWRGVCTVCGGEACVLGIVNPNAVYTLL